jgi:hypothetical protein
MRKIKIYILLFVLLLILLFVIESTKPKPVDWSPSFNRNHKKPWGTYILFNELNTLFKEATINTVDVTPYEKLKHQYYKLNTDTVNNTPTKKTYIFLNDYVDIDKESVNSLLQFVKNGNTVFISAKSVSTYLKDTLKFKTKHKYFYNFNDTTTNKEMLLANKELQQQKFIYNKGFEGIYLDTLKPETSTILGYNFVEGKKYINFVKIKYGKGDFFIHLQPYAFTNYHLLKDNHHLYASNVFSYIDTKEILWDTKIKTGTNVSKSSLRFILSHPPLKWAWRLAWLGLIIFVIFRAKRKQRIIPIINKPENTSIAFAKTIGNMYFNEGKPKDIIDKKIKFFLEFIRNRYLLDTQNLNKEFIKRLHHKSGVDNTEINRLINYIINLSKNDDLKEHHLITLNKLLEKFYNKIKI